jgi:hypothetical protein
MAASETWLPSLPFARPAESVATRSMNRHVRSSTTYGATYRVRSWTPVAGPYAAARDPSPLYLACPPATCEIP